MEFIDACERGDLADVERQLGLDGDRRIDVHARNGMAFRWGERRTSDVAKDYAQRVGPGLWETNGLKEMGTPDGKDLESWVEATGARTVRGVAEDNEADA